MQLYPTFLISATNFFIFCIQKKTSCPRGRKIYTLKAVCSKKIG